MTAAGLTSEDRSFRQTTTWRAALAALLAIPIGIAWSMVDDPSPWANPVLLWITVLSVVLYVLVCIVIGKTVFVVSDRGVRRESVFGVQEALWSEIKETRYVERPIRAGAHFGLIGVLLSAATKAAARSSLKLTLITSDEGRLTLTSNFKNAKDAANTILAELLPQMIAAARSRLQRGETVRFGTIALTLTDLAWKSQPGVPLNELEKAEIVSGVLKVKQSGKWRTFISISSDRVPDVFVLLELLDEMAPQLRQRLDPLARVRS